MSNNHDTSVMVGVIQGIDWVILAKQKLALVELVHSKVVSHEQKQSLTGILRLLDAMTDAAYNDGLMNQTLEGFQRSDAVIQQASHYLKAAADMSTDQLDDWYEQRVGYRISQDDPSLIGKPEHGYAIAEMMCLHEHGEGEIYLALRGLIEKAKK